MANVVSAAKRARQALKRRTRNTEIKASTKSDIRKAVEAISKAKDKKEALVALVAAERSLRKAASKGAIPVERASRKTSRLAASISAKFKN